MRFGDVMATGEWAGWSVPRGWRELPTGGSANRVGARSASRLLKSTRLNSVNKVTTPIIQITQLLRVEFLTQMRKDRRCFPVVPTRERFPFWALIRNRHLYRDTRRLC